MIAAGLSHLAPHIFFCWNVEFIDRFRVTHTVFIKAPQSVPHPFSGNGDWAAHMPAEKVMLEGSRVLVLHQEMNQPDIARIHFRLALAERDSSAVCDGEVG